MACSARSKNKKSSKQSKHSSSTLPKKNDIKTNLITNYFPLVSRRLLAAQSKVDDYNNQIRHYIETATDPKESLNVTEFDEKGQGIIASDTIRKGGFICEYSGDLIQLDEAKEREQEYERKGAGCYMYYFQWNSKIWCIDATRPTGRYGRLINHSRKAPNCKTKVFEHNGIPHLIFIALRDIKPEEEILYDYGERDPNAIRSNPWLKLT